MIQTAIGFRVYEFDRSRLGRLKRIALPEDVSDFFYMESYGLGLLCDAFNRCNRLACARSRIALWS
jgi:hypothetical protein